MLPPLIVAVLSVIPQPTEVQERNESVPATTPIAVTRDATIAPEGYVLDVRAPGSITIRLRNFSPKPIDGPMSVMVYYLSFSRMGI